MVNGAKPPPVPKANQKRPDLRIGPFLLVDELGGSGHARMFRARHRPEGRDRIPGLDTDQIVVLKVLRDAALKQSKTVDAFTREAELLTMIDHPAVVRGITRGVHQGRMWTAVEYVEGEDLTVLATAARQERLRLRPELAITIACDLLAGLAAAQALVDPRGRPMGLIHRDVSPKSVLLDMNGQTKLAELGTALLSLREEPTEVVGTPGYIAPEVARGDQLTQSVDVFAAATILYELLTGTRCFEVDQLPDKALLKASAEPKRPTWPQLDLPNGLQKLVDVALSPVVEDRPPDAAAFFRLLAPLVRDFDEARRRLAVVAKDLVRTNPDRPDPFFVT